MGAIDKRLATSRYTDYKFHASLHDRELPTLDEIFGVSSEESTAPGTVDDEAARKLEEHALKRIAAGRM